MERWRRWAAGVYSGSAGIKIKTLDQVESNYEQKTFIAEDRVREAAVSWREVLFVSLQQTASTSAAVG